MILYLDTSALMKLVVDEPGSDLAREAYKRAEEAATSLITYAEARAVLARAGVVGLSSRNDLRRARDDLDDLWAEMTTLKVDPLLVARAGDAAERLVLKGLDAIHVASALVLRDDAGQAVRFASWDKRQRQGADRERLPLVPASLS